jgi:transposase
LIPAQFVRPFVKSNKNDYLDAEAIAEAVQRPTMRFKDGGSARLTDAPSVRDRLVSRRTGVINQLRAFLLERGITVRQGRAYLRRTMPSLLADAEEKLSPRMFRIIAQLRAEWLRLEEQLQEIDAEIGLIAKQDAACRRLLDMPGVGPLLATALVSAVGNGSAFCKGRQLSAWLGLVPKQQSTGGTPKLLGISKRGSPYLRRLFIHGARSVLMHSGRQNRLGEWITQLELRSKRNVAVVALANKLARIAWAVLASGNEYRCLPVAPMPG